MNIQPLNSPGSHKTATIFGLSADQVAALIGFPPNVKDDPYKVSHSWGFTADGKPFGVWSWKGSEKRNEFSACGSVGILAEIFGAQHVKN